MSLFEKWWAALRARKVPFEVSNWTVDNGYIGNPFRVTDTSDTSVTIDQPSVTIPKDDFAEVFAIWPDCVAGRYQRHQIRDKLTRHSKYIISILHQMPPQSASTQP